MAVREAARTQRWERALAARVHPPVTRVAPGWFLAALAVVALLAGSCSGPATVATAPGDPDDHPGTSGLAVRAGGSAVPAYPAATDGGPPGSTGPDGSSTTLASTTLAPNVGTGTSTTTTLARGVTATVTAPPPSIAPGSGIGTGGSIIPPRGPGSVEGLVTDATSLVTLANVRVWLLTRDGDLAGSTATGADGRYHFPSVAKGAYRLSFHDATTAHGSVFFPAAPDAEQGTVLNVDGKVVKADARLYLTAEQPIPPYAGSPTGQRIAVIGDSLVQTSTSTILRTMRPIGLVSVQGLNAKRVDQLQPVAGRYGATRPTTVVIALGTNDVDQEWPLDATLGALRTMVDTFPATCIVVVNVNTRTPNLAFNGRAAALNTAIIELAAGRASTHVADWAARSAELQGSGPASRWFTDGIHLTAEGMTEYAALMFARVQSCA